MESSFQPRCILNLIRSIQHCRRTLMAEKDAGRLPCDEPDEFEAAVTGMVSVEKALLSGLTTLIADEVNRRRGSLEVELDGDVSYDENLETLTAIIGALEPNDQQQGSSAAAAPAPVAPISIWFAERGMMILNIVTRFLDMIMEDLLFRALTRLIQTLFFGRWQPN